MFFIFFCFKNPSCVMIYGVVSAVLLILSECFRILNRMKWDWIELNWICKRIFAKCRNARECRLTRWCDGIICSQWSYLCFRRWSVRVENGNEKLENFVNDQNPNGIFHGIAYLVLLTLWFNVSFLLRLKFDMDAGKGDRCNSLKSPEYLWMKTINF